jgi:hypothetical protein
MINQGNNVPDKTVAIFFNKTNEDIKMTNERMSKIIYAPDKKRDWFDSHFYRCLPLTIGNRYGFVVTSEYDFAFEWNGGLGRNDIHIWCEKEAIELSETVDRVYPHISSHFGHGILTISPPFVLRTPPGINLMTINPPNYVIPNVTHMTGVIETDNIRRNFTFNLKVQMPNIQTFIPKGTPLAAFIPIPRYFADEFELKFAEDIFSKEVVDEELKANFDALEYRENVEPTLKHGVGKHYMVGTDVYGNPFPDHQKF